MSDFIEIDGHRVKVKMAEHESGVPMILLHPFFPNQCNREKISALIESAVRLNPAASFSRIYLTASQVVEKNLLLQMGFSIDGYEYGAVLMDLTTLVSSSKVNLPGNFLVRKMEYERDIDRVVEIERSVHAADKSSRVSFDSDRAIASMRRYYERACCGIGVLLLEKDAEIVGILGFLPDRHREKAIHISSAAICLNFQGQGLFFPFLTKGLEKIDSMKYEMVTGVTTTKRLINFAEKHSIKLIGLTLSHEIEKARLI